MMHVWKKLLAAMLILAMLLPMLGASAEDTPAYGVCTGNQIKVRKSIGGDYWFKVDEGHVAQILGTRTGDDGELWYKIESPHPVPNGHTYTGYIMGDYFRPMTDAEIRAYLKTNPAASSATKTGIRSTTDDSLGRAASVSNTEVSGAMGMVTADDVRFRAQPNTGATILAKLDEGTMVELLTIPDQISVNDWYCVRYKNEVGYIQANFIRVTDKGDYNEPDAIAMGMTVNTNGVNFRTGPGTKYTSMGRLPSGEALELLSIPTKVDASHWYYVRYNGKLGYIQAPYVQVLGQDAPVVPGKPTAAPVVSTGMTTSTSGVKFRTGPGTRYSYYGKLPEGTVVELLSIPETIDEEHWYKARYNNRTGYIQAPFIRVLSVNENDLPAVTKYGYAKLIKDSRVNLRDAAGGNTVIQWSGKGSLMRIVGEPQQKGLYTWYPVYHVDRATILYVRSDMIQVVKMQDGSVVPAPSAPPSAYGYVITTHGDVNLRIKPAEDYIAKVPRNVILPCVGPSVQKVMDGITYTWYKVKYDGMTGYLRGDCVRVCSATGGDPEGMPTPEPTEDPSTSTTVYGYIKLNTGRSVHLRKTQLGKSLGTLPHGTVLPVMGEPTPYGQYGKYTWYPVRDANNRFGWIRGDCVVECDEYGNVPGTGTDQPVTPPEDDTPDLVGVSGRTLVNAYLYKGASADSGSITILPANAVVAVLRIPADTKNGWYKVSYSGTKGYVYAAQMEVITSSGDDPAQPSLGYIMITGNRVAVRKTAAGIELTRVATGTVWPIIGKSVNTNGVNWFNVKAGGYVGYVHGDFAFKLSPEQEESYLAGNGVPTEKPGVNPGTPVGKPTPTPTRTPTPAHTPTPVPDGVSSGYLITVNTRGLNIRESASQDSTSYGKVPSGVVMQYFATKKVGTVTWYCVLYDHQERWVHGNYVDVMTRDEYASWAAANPSKLPNRNGHLGYLKTNQSNVYVRNAANGSTRVGLIRTEGTVMRYYTNAISAGGAGWYRVLTPDNVYCYVRSDLVEKCDENGDDLSVTPPHTGNQTSAPQSQQETSYTTLNPGDGGSGAKATKVRNLVQELKNQGYYNGKVTNVYTNDVKAAVKAFQTVKGLYANGIADSATQHKLFGTVPIGAGNTNNLDFAIYPVEKIDWFTGGIQDMIPRGSNFKVYDVKTGIVWWAHRWAGGSHADIETLTAADSERLCRIYGVKNLQEIVENNMFQRRPCLVTIGTRTFACSLDGMQHNPDGDTIPNNGMDGQVCMHFTNSKGHESGAVSEKHAEAIEYAYNHCPAGKK